MGKESIISLVYLISEGEYYGGELVKVEERRSEDSCAQDGVVQDQVHDQLLPEAQVV